MTAEQTEALINENARLLTENARLKAHLAEMNAGLIDLVRSLTPADKRRVHNDIALAAVQSRQS